MKLFYEKSRLRYCETDPKKMLDILEKYQIILFVDSSNQNHPPAQKTQRLYKKEIRLLINQHL